MGVRAGSLFVLQDDILGSHKQQLAGDTTTHCRV